jgi:hypothetical protein
MRYKPNASWLQVGELLGCADFRSHHSASPQLHTQSRPIASSLAICLKNKMLLHPSQGRNGNAASALRRHRLRFTPVRHSPP